MKQTLQLRLGQQLTMTPQMQQAIRLLQVPAMELKAEIQEALESNLMLELVEDGTEREVVEAEHDQEAPDWDLTDTDWTGGHQAGGSDAAEWATVAADDLYGHLRWQLALTPFGPRDALIAEAIIECLDDDGYLHGGLEVVQDALPTEFAAADAEVETVLHRLQRFDPVGIGARTLSECLGVQLGQLRDGPVVALAKRIVEEHLDRLADGDLKAVAKALAVDADSVEEAVDLIRTLDPRPGSAIGPAVAGYIVPDVLVRRRDGDWQVELNPELMPRLRINPGYEALVDRGGDAADRECMKRHLHEARWLLRSLQTRADTLLQVASHVIDHQRAWLEHGDTAMRPLVLREVAETVGLHESTVSRATAGKFILTPRGMFPFRHFFSNELSGGSGTSATAVRARIRQLIAEEPPAQPLSDGRIAELLAAMGLPVARRTVAKYRESMSIPATHERRVTRQIP